MARAFDEKELLERVDNDRGFLAETVQMLAMDGRSLLAEVKAAAGDGDALAMGRCAHTLKGMISNFCSPGAHEAAFAVEKIGKSGNMAAAAPAVQELESQFYILITELTDYMGMGG